MHGKCVSGRPAAARSCSVAPRISRPRVANVRADYIGDKKGQNNPPPAAATSVKEETTVPTALKPTPVVEAAAPKPAPPAAPAPAADALADLQNLKEIISTACKAQQVYSEFKQEQVDAIFKAAAGAASAARIDLAVMAVEETRM